MGFTTGNNELFFGSERIDEMVVTGLYIIP